MPDDLAAHGRAALVANWQPEGYTAPNQRTYPWQWLWDSCFHALVWLELGEPDRAAVELESVFRWQTPLGFVPHMGYQRDPDASVEFWGRRGASTITQPPMYGIAVAELIRSGALATERAERLVVRAAEGLRWLLRNRRRGDGDVVILHPWESGCDDSPRWDAWHPGGAFAPSSWKETKGSLVASLDLDDEGAAIDNAGFAVASAGFESLVAANASALATVGGGDTDDLRRDAREITELVDARWDSAARTWTDRAFAGVESASPGPASCRVRTLDALLPVLTPGSEDHRFDAWAELAGPAAFGAPYGPRGVHPDEATYQPAVYWRGPTWPQLSYLCWRAANDAVQHGIAHRLAVTTVAGAATSGLAEYWDPETGEPGGAIPQSWTALAIPMERGMV